MYMLFFHTCTGAGQTLLKAFLKSNVKDKDWNNGYGCTGEHHRPVCIELSLEHFDCNLNGIMVFRSYAIGHK